MSWVKKVCLFDLDWTILDYRFYPNIYEKIISTCGIEGLSPDDLRRLIWNKSLELIKKGKFLDSHDWDLVLDLVLEDLGVSCSVSFSHLVVEDVISSGVPFKPGARDVLLFLRKKGFLLGVLTNGFIKYQRVKVDVSGINKLVDFIIYIDDAGSIKPFKEFFRVAFDLASSLGGEVEWYIGDSLFFDVLGGFNAGIENVVWYRDKGDVSSGKYTLEDLDKHLERLLSLYNGLFPIRDFLEKEFFVVNSHFEILELIL